MNTYKHVNKKKRGNILQENSDFKEILLPILQNNDYFLADVRSLQNISDQKTQMEINLNLKEIN